MAVGNQVEDVEVEKVSVQLEVLAELAMSDCPPFFFGHQLSVVILNPTAPVVRHFANNVLVLHLLSFKVSFCNILEVKVVIVVVHIDANKTFRHDIETVDVLEVIVDLNPAILP